MTRKTKTAEKSPVKNNPGRPSNYDPEICMEVIKLGSEGLTRKEIAAKLDINRDTLYEWMDKYPEFKKAMDDAMDRSEAWFTAQLRAGQFMGGKYNATAAALYANNVYGWSSKEKSQGDTNINIGNINVLQDKSKEELIDLIAEKLERTKIYDAVEYTRSSEE